jgi:hypothetical protein
LGLRDIDFVTGAKSEFDPDEEEEEIRASIDEMRLLARGAGLST